jgi:hypothetical protein
VANRFDSEMKDVQQSWAGGLVSDPNSKMSYINPVNYILEDAVALHALGDTLSSLAVK